MRRKKSRVKQQHYVPKYYLKQFVNANGKFYAYNMFQRKKRPVIVTPKDVCKSRHFYDIKSENIKVEDEQFIDEVMTDFESQHFNPAIDLVKKNLFRAATQNATYLNVPIDVKRRWYFCVYVQKIRTPIHKEYVVSVKKSSLRNELEKRYKTKARVKIADRDASIAYAEHILDEKQRITVLEEYERDYTLHFVYNFTKSPFVTSDNPVTVVLHEFGTTGRVVPGFLAGDFVFMPITKSIGVILRKKTCMSFGPINENEIIYLDNISQVDFYNQWTFLNAQKFVFTSTPAHRDILNKIFEQEPDLYTEKDPRLIVKHDEIIYSPWDEEDVDFETEITYEVESLSQKE